jgi:DNA-directed RNA polymerase subunit RPC12/RpoP
MSETFINLNCANCGAKLDVYDDMERFACGYCGAEMIVQRRGGTVALKAVTEAIKKVAVGTDKMAAELALARLNQESGVLSEELQKLLNARSGVASGRKQVARASIISGLTGALFLLIFFTFANGGPLHGSDLFIGLALAGFSLYCRFALLGGARRRQLAEAQIEQKQAELAEVKNRIAQHRRIVD